MDMFEGGFKIQEMIDSDIRSSGLDDFLSSDMPHSPDTDLTSLPPATPMDMTENSLDSVDGGLGWMNSSQLYNLSGDFDCMEGLVVNPQKVLSVSIAERNSVQTTDSVVITSNHSLKTESPPTSALSTSSHILTVPVQVITTTAALLNQQADSGKGQVNLTVAVPTPSPSPHHALGQQLLTIQQFNQASESVSTESSKPKPKSKQNSKATQISPENSYPKPAYSYSCLIAMALKNSKTGSLPVNEIYDFMTENFPYFKTAPTGWKNSVRHNLSLNKCFEKIEKPSKNGTQRKGYLWAMNPAKVEKMEEELQKWGSKNLAAIKKSMANPERLELIEKGELKNADDEFPCENPMSEEREESKCNHKKGDAELRNSVESLAGELSNSSFCALGETVNMDSSLPELDLQRGVWDNLCDDRLQFLSDSPMSSSPKQLDMLGSTIVNADEDSSSASSPSDLPKSFTHANYVYSYAESSSSSSPSPQSNGSFQLLRHSSMTPSSEKSTTCDA